MMEFANYGQERDLICTEQEREIFEMVKSIAGADLELVRRSDNYVTAALGEWDVARIKYTNRAKWVQFPIFDRGSAKHRIESVEDVRQWSQIILDSIDHIRKYS